MEAPVLQHRFKFPLHDHVVTMEIYAYRKLHDFEIQSCVDGYVRSLKKKKLKKNIIIKWMTIFGATPGI